jgi:hypothetical protein
VSRPSSGVRCLTLALGRASLGEAVYPLDPPLLVRLSGPYEDGTYVAACPEIYLAVSGPAPAHCLGQIRSAPSNWVKRSKWLLYKPQQSPISRARPADR